MSKVFKKKSKRMSCRRKYKIMKKVAEHKRKLRRDKKNNPKKGKLKDPGVPNSAPFTEEVLQQAERRKQIAKDLKEAQKASRLKLQMQNRGLEDVLREEAVKKKPRETEDRVAYNSNDVQRMKSYYRELRNVVEKADVVLEVLDARDPLGCRCPQAEELVISSGKKLVLLLNKIDLIPRSNLEAWLKYLRLELPTVAFKASTQQQTSHLSHIRVAAVHMNEKLQASRNCIGASFLMKLLGNYCRNQNIQTSIIVGVVGFPNVGKSSIINSLKRAKSCLVGTTPGITKSIQEVSLDKHIKILDCPGIVLAKGNSSTTLALRNAVRLETLDDVISPAEAIVQRADHTQLCMHYCIPKFSSTDELLCSLAKKMGKYKKRGIPNAREAAKKLVKDWNSGKIKYFTHPPEEFELSSHISAEYVSQMGKAFDVSMLEETMELDKIPLVTPAEAIIAKPVGFTNGKISATSVEPEEEDEEEEEEDEMNVEDTSKNITVTVDPKKQRKMSESDVKELLEKHQKNKAVKKAFKRMKRRRDKVNKATAKLSDAFDNAMSIE